MQHKIIQKLINSEEEGIGWCSGGKEGCISLFVFIVDQKKIF